MKAINFKSEIVEIATKDGDIKYAPVYYINDKMTYVSEQGRHVVFDTYEEALEYLED